MGTKKHNMYQLYMYSIPPDDGLQIFPRHVEVDRRKKLSMNNASSWFSLHGHPDTGTGGLWCSVTGRGLAGHQLDTTWAKVLRLCYQMTTESDLFEAATTMICTVECS